MSWRPIDTAPKDGTPILLFLAERRQPIAIGEWEHSVRITNGVTTYDYAGWRIERAIGFSTHSFNPTHWMPLPEAPDA